MVGLDDTYQFDPACKLRFYAQAISGPLRHHERRDRTEIELICPTSGAIFHNDGRSSFAGHTTEIMHGHLNLAAS
jgi:hypothetical protein